LRDSYSRYLDQARTFLRFLSSRMAGILFLCKSLNTSDIPPLTEEFFSKSRWWKPVASLNVLLQIEPETLAWFQSQGEDYEKRMAAAVRIYAEAHQMGQK
jgi:hypothetical protein